MAAPSANAGFLGPRLSSPRGPRGLGRDGPCPQPPGSPLSGTSPLPPSSRRVPRTGEEGGAQEPQPISHPGPKATIRSWARNSFQRLNSTEPKIILTPWRPPRAPISTQPRSGGAGARPPQVSLGPSGLPADFPCQLPPALTRVQSQGCLNKPPTSQVPSPGGGSGQRCGSGRTPEPAEEDGGRGAGGAAERPAHRGGECVRDGGEKRMGV